MLNLGTVKILQDFLRMLHAFELKIKIDKQVITKKFHLTAKDKLMYNTTHVHVHIHVRVHAHCGIINT